MGKKKNKADALTEIEEEQLWSRGALGDSSSKNPELHNVLYPESAVWHKPATSHGTPEIRA